MILNHIWDWRTTWIDSFISLRGCTVCLQLNHRPSVIIQQMNSAWTFSLLKTLSERSFSWLLYLHFYNLTDLILMSLRFFASLHASSIKQLWSHVLFIPSLPVLPPQRVGWLSGLSFRTPAADRSHIQTYSGRAGSPSRSAPQSTLHLLRVQRCTWRLLMQSYGCNRLSVKHSVLLVYWKSVNQRLASAADTQRCGGSGPAVALLQSQWTRRPLDGQFRHWHRLIPIDFNSSAIILKKSGRLNRGETNCR